MDITKMLNDVAEFQKASEQPVRNKPSVGTMMDATLRYDLMTEETTEYLDACVNKDKKEILDACIDKMYILLGTINTHGLQEPFKEGFKRVHENNMTKVVDGKVIRNSAGKILKPEGFVPVELSDLV